MDDYKYYRYFSLLLYCFVGEHYRSTCFGVFISFFFLDICTYYLTVECQQLGRFDKLNDPDYELLMMKTEQLKQ